MKKIHRFLISHVPHEEAFPLVDKRIVHQCASVLALKPGEEIILFEDGGSDQVFTVVSIDKRKMVLHKERVLPSVLPPRSLIAAIAIPKGATFDLIVQKLTEIGVATIVPVKTARTVKASVRLERLQTISDEALEQCGGARRVSIHEPMTLGECMTAFPFPSIVFDHHAGPLSSIGNQERIVMYVGPEGGWAPEDDALLLSQAVATASLGPRVLRTETAAIVGAYELLRLS